MFPTAHTVTTHNLALKIIALLNGKCRWRIYTPWISLFFQDNVFEINGYIFSST